jgi:pyruvate dehydrogenase E2 component (dihydrolipoamide acetyltransferase)
MATAITIPRLGWNMEEGVFHGWLKRDGDQVRAGESLFTLESEKATEDIECLDNGILRIPPDSPKGGDQVRVGDVIGYLVEQGEAPPFDMEPTTSQVKEALIQASEMPAGQLTNRLTGPQVHSERRNPSISPRARRVAGELGVDWTKLKGSGRTGRIRERDVRAACAGQFTSSVVPPLGGNVKPPEGGTTNSLHRRIIAERMRRSLSSTAPVTLTTTVDAVNLVSLRQQFKTAAAADSAVPSYTDFLVKLTAIALQNHPALNARWEEDRIVPSPEVHIGVAVDTEAGLVVPVIRRVPALALREVAALARDLIDRARRGKLRAEEMQGGTFTVSNLGAYGIDAFTSIINLPQCAILGMGRIQRLPAVRDDQIVPRDQMVLSLTFDHRIVDGAPAARFLQELAKLIENPGPSLMS